MSKGILSVDKKMISAGNISSWISGPWFDTSFILLPPILSLLLIFLFPQVFSDQNEVSVTQWVILVMCIDVAHVYSTLFRTYFDKDTFISQKKLLLYIPVFSWVAGVIVYALSPLFFWRILAYLAVYHFIRQQYGFMKIYSRKDQSGIGEKIIDTAAVYAATIYPVLYWHLEGNRKFNWFVEGDFISLTSSSFLLIILEIIYLLIVLIYVIKEIIFLIKFRKLNVPKNLLLIGTLSSWYFGIVYFNGDLPFTLLNVVSHGIPYMALIWAFGQKKYSSADSGSRLSLLFSKKGVIIFIAFIVLLAFVEESLWDTVVWQDHAEVFGFLYFIPEVPEMLLSFIVPLLSVPQITHYIIDGYIWKISRDRFNWKNVTLGI